MGHSSKHKKSKRHGKDGTRRDRHSPRTSITQLEELIASVEERQQSLARQHDEYRGLQEQAEILQDRLEDAEQTLSLLSSTSLAAQQARGLSSTSGHSGHQAIRLSSREQQLRAEIQTLPVSIAEFERRAAAMAELMARNQDEIERLQARIDEIRAAEEAEAEAAWYGGQQGGTDPGWMGDPGSGGGGGSYGYFGAGQASSSASYSQYGGA
ncbi:hypothetical protein BHE90_016654 [Fusarium euwallaceae]|uniref:Uncharacterized protein n=1 Tax=Fusarium euwallaceae TaxID=1147111 RepID=A0A430KZT5_9HYPO|nr:hypothetical protein BHE90_016654 [Fusarium euwallaceae]